LLPRIFGASVVTREGPIPTAMPALPPEEAACVANAALVRKLDFAAGRSCARSALEALGIHGYALINAPSGAPKWPDAVVGSITHTRRTGGGFAAAVAAARSVVRSLGIDAESDQGLTEDLWPSVLRDEERAHLATLPPSERVRTASLMFSAKECFYKLQYPLTGQFLDFAAATIGVDAAGGAFEVTVRRDAGAAFRVGDTLHGRFARGEGLVVTGMELLAT
ncbi:MAG TPA: 4'-phosphopantetheinyl transferase superfamily protein, partial [Polyangiaceae bacterium]|nr:4'-phosphopantetheinyl transferase superfamily protein [Polyangiaceae bacterium]